MCHTTYRGGMEAYRRPRALTALVATVALTTMLAACADSGGSGTTTTSASPTGTSTVTSTATPVPQSTDADATTTAQKEQKEKPLGEPDRLDKVVTGTWADPPPVLTGIRSGSHDGFDRVVFDFTGAGAPGWMAGYVDQPAQQGSGFPVHVEGGAYLMVNMTNTTYPFEQNVEDFPTGAYPGTGVIREVVSTGVFEGESLAYIGVDKKRPFSVTLLQNPTRVVVDVAHD